MNKKTLTIYFILSLVILTGGCSAFSDFKGVIFKDKKTAEGKRIPILQAESDLTPSAELKDAQMNLPESWVNESWPQTGGYPNHAMGQLELGRKLKKVWSAYIGSDSYDFNPLVISPIAVKHTVFTLDNRSQLSAFKLSDGSLKWRFSLKPKDENKGNIGGGLAYAEGRLFITNGYKQLICANPDTGKLIWKTPLPSPARSAPTVSEGKVYLITLNNQLMVFSTADGSLLWNYSGINNTTNLLGSSTPAVQPSLVVLPLSSGELIGLRPENGQVVWGDNISASSRTDTLFSISDIKGMPVIDQGTIYASSFSGRLVAIDEVSGQRLWQQKIGSSEMLWSAGDALFVINNDQHLIALNRQTGAVYWIKELQPKEKNKKLNTQAWKGPVFAGGRLIIASTKGRVLEIDPQTGKILNSFKTEDGVVVTPIVANNTLLLLTEEGELIAYRSKKGKK